MNIVNGNTVTCGGAVRVHNFCRFSLYFDVMKDLRG